MTPAAQKFLNQKLPTSGPDVLFIFLNGIFDSGTKTKTLWIAP